MGFFEWQDEYSVHVQQIDDQHKKVIAMINEIQATFFENACLETQKKVINSMIDYSEVHFSTEEKYMAEFNYPLSAEHIAEHEKFREKAKGLKLKVHDQGYFISMELLAYLQAWWKNHIIVTDMKYSKFFNQHGLK